MLVKFFDYPSIYTRFKNEFNEIFEDVCSRGAFILQKDLEDFEHGLEDYTGIKHVVGVNDGTNAIILGLIASGVKSGDEIIISPHTYVATAYAIKVLGARPVCADVDYFGYLNANSLENFLSGATVGIMPTQVNGFCCDMAAIVNFAQENKLKIFEDSAQGLGARYKGVHAGGFGTFGTLSFYPAKLIGCFGDGGAILTNDSDVAEKVKRYRDHGREDGKIVGLGTNARLDNLQAAFLSLRLRHFNEDLQRRREIAKCYGDILSKYSEVIIPNSLASNINYCVSYQNYEIQVQNREEFVAYLLKHNISTMVQWGGKAIYELPEYRDTLLSGYDYKNVNLFFQRSVMLPMHMGLSDEQIIYVCKVLKNYFEK